MSHSQHVSDRELSNESDSDIVDSPLTLNSVIKWSGIMLTVITAMVSLVWFVAVIKGDILVLQQEVGTIQSEQHAKNLEQDNAINKLNDHINATDRSVVELDRKLDVAVAILERIDKKVGSN